MTDLVDGHKRRIDYLRISITDHCNLSCIYCSPMGGREKLSHTEILSYEEIIALVEAAAMAGIRKVRITGGEPLIRKGMEELCRMLSAIEGLESLTLTTNGVFLAERAKGLFAAGVGRVNVSLDSLKRDRYAQIAGQDFLDRVLLGIEKAQEVGFSPVKINTVVMRGINNDEVADFARMTIEEPLEVRFIELMPTKGEARTRHESLFVPIAEIIAGVEGLGELTPAEPSDSFGPARLYSLPGSKGKVGFIAPLSNHFCSTCNRLRLTADGKLRVCLFSGEELDLKGPLREGAPREELAEIFRLAAAKKPSGHELSEKDVPKGKGLAKEMRSIGG